MSTLTNEPPHSNTTALLCNMQQIRANEQTLDSLPPLANLHQYSWRSRIYSLTTRK